MGAQPYSPGQAGDGSPERQLTRRVFIGGSAALAGSAYLATLIGGGPLGLNPFRVLVAAAETISPPSKVADFTIAAERDIDLVLLDFKFYGFALQKVKGVATLVPTVSSSADTGDFTSNLIVVQLPPQSIGEAAYPVKPNAVTAQSAAPLPVDPPPIVSAVAGPSRLCFTLQSGVTVPLPTMTVDDLLDWSQWTLVVPTTAQVNPPGPNGYPTPYEPGPFETAIEFPYSLFLAPVVFVSAGTISAHELSPAYHTFFSARAKPLYNGPIADLWTASLGRNNSLAGQLTHQATPPAQVAAVWAYDYYYEANFAPPPPSATPADEIFYQPAQPK